MKRAIRSTPLPLDRTAAITAVCALLRLRSARAFTPRACGHARGRGRKRPGRRQRHRARSARQPEDLHRAVRFAGGRQGRTAPDPSRMRRQRAARRPLQAARTAGRRRPDSRRRGPASSARAPTATPGDGTPEGAAAALYRPPAGAKPPAPARARRSTSRRGSATRLHHETRPFRSSPERPFRRASFQNQRGGLPSRRHSILSSTLHRDRAFVHPRERHLRDFLQERFSTVRRLRLNLRPARAGQRHQLVFETTEHRHRRQPLFRKETSLGTEAGAHRQGRPRTSRSPPPAPAAFSGGTVTPRVDTASKSSVPGCAIATTARPLANNAGELGTASRDRPHRRVATARGCPRD